MTSPVDVGDLIADKYRVERVLGKGGMGVVVAAVHVKLGQRVAVKFLLASVGTTPAILARFEREARAAVALHSEHVARVLDVGRLPNDAPYMVMELLEGTDLAEELRLRKRLPTHEAAAHILQACDAIAEAHGHGIIHRDIKPANLFLAQRPRRAPIVKVLDFGISKATTLAEGVADITSTHELIGSPLYMSPEQLRAPKTVDARSDVWSLGATLYELVSGVPPFDGETMAELSAHIMMTPVVDVRLRDPAAGIRDDFAEVIARCLAKDPAERYPTVDALAAALTPFATMTATKIAPFQNPMATTSAPPASLGPVAEDEKRATSEAAVSYPPPAVTKSSGRRAGLPIALVVLATAGVAIVALTEGARSSRTSSSAAAPPSATALPTPSASASALATASASAPALPASAPATSITARTSVRPAGTAPSSRAASSSTAPPVASVAPPKPSASSPLILKLE